MAVAPRQDKKIKKLKKDVFIDHSKHGKKRVWSNVKSGQNL